MCLVGDGTIAWYFYSLFYQTFGILCSFLRCLLELSCHIPLPTIVFLVSFAGMVKGKGFMYCLKARCNDGFGSLWTLVDFCLLP